MFKRVLVSAVAAMLVCCGSGANAKTLKYTFNGFCDGVILTVTDGNTYAGTHAGCTNHDPAGGFLVKVVGGTANKYGAIATSDSLNTPGVVFTFYLDFKNLDWFLYTSDGTNFTLANSGALVKGAPKMRAGQMASTAPGARGRHLIPGPLPLPNQNQ